MCYLSFKSRNTRQLWTAILFCILSIQNTSHAGFGWVDDVFKAATKTAKQKELLEMAEKSAALQKSSKGDSKLVLYLQEGNIDAAIKRTHTLDPGISDSMVKEALASINADYFSKAISAGDYFKAEKILWSMGALNHNYEKRLSLSLKRYWEDWQHRIHLAMLPDMKNDPIRYQQADRYTERSVISNSKGFSNAMIRNNTYPNIEDFRLLKSFDSVVSISRVRYVSSDIKKFVREFTSGAYSPEEAFKILEPHNPAIVKKWKSTRAEKRVFLAGSGEDLTKVKKIKEQLEADGYAVFFYKFCVQQNGTLCPSSVVGAFFKTAGKALLVDTPQAALSRYVAVEVGSAQRLASDEAHLILISPRQLTITVSLIAVPTTIIIIKNKERKEQPTTTQWPFLFSK